MNKKTFKLLSFIALSAITTQAKAQGWNVNTPGTEVTTQSGVNKVGIGTATPSRELTVNGDIDYTPQTNTWDTRAVDGNTPGGLFLYSQQGDANGSSVRINSNGGTWGDGSIGFVAGGNIGSTTTAFEFQVNNNNTLPHIMKMHKNGNTEFNGKIYYSPQYNTWETREIDGNTPGGLFLYSQQGDANGSSVRINSNGGTWGDGSIGFVAGGNVGSSATAFEFQVNTNNNLAPLIKIRKDGKVGIGDAWANMPDGYKLFVEKGILTEKVKVALLNDPTNWSDFVFDENYDLRPLSEVEKFIKKNKHLPEIPSTEEVHKEGLDLAQMDAKLLQKVEELTLYVIQQQKEINELKKKLK